jgi:hypothetical protein
MLVLDLGTSVLVVCDVSGRLHESVRGAERHICFWWTLRSVRVIENSFEPQSGVGVRVIVTCGLNGCMVRWLDEGAHN